MARDWATAHQGFLAAGELGAMPAQDIESLAQTAYLLGREDECVRHMERAHQAYLAERQTTRAARSAFWIGLTLMFMGQTAAAMGWFQRAERILGGEESDCVERGYLLLPMAEKHMHAGDLDAALSCAREALVSGERFDDRDLKAVALHMQGRVRLLRGEVREGLALLDEAMIFVTSGELSPRVTGLLYCGAIQECRRLCELERAREWTRALTHWCDEQPELLAFTGTCMVHRAEVLESLGQWNEAAVEAEKARARFELAGDLRAQGAALYRRGEVHRLTGQLDEAGQAFEASGEMGYDPQPGLALLRLAQGRAEQAAAAIDRVLSTKDNMLEASEALAAAVEIHVGAGNLERARSCGDELERIAERLGTDVLLAKAAHARGQIQIAAGEPREAVLSLRRAQDGWHRAKAPYAAAHTRLLTGLCCQTLGDVDGARLEFSAARAEFERLGALADLERVRAFLGEQPHNASVLSARELEVLKLVATGKTSKAIAGELGLSVKTIDRHLSNVFNKLNVSSRAEATAYAYQHRII